MLSVGSASNYNTLTQRIKTAKNSFFGGDVVAILLRQAIRQRAMAKYAAFKARQYSAMNAAVEPISNPKSIVAQNIPITAMQQEAYYLNSDATRFAVESGVVVSDHIILNPIRVDLSFEVSNWEGGTSQQAFEAIEDHWRSRTPVDLLTSMKTIKNMVLINFQGSNSVPQWGKLACRATFQQVGLIGFEEMDSAKFAPAKNTGGPDNSRSAEPETDSGMTKPRKVERDKSSLYKMVDGAWKKISGKGLDE